MSKPGLPVAVAVGLAAMMLDAPTLAERQQQTPPLPQEPGAQEPPASPQRPAPAGLLPLTLIAEIDPGAASADGPNGKKARPNAPALLYQGRLIFTTDSGEARCFDADTGASLWKLDLPGAPTLPPTSAPTGILLARGDGHLLLVDPERGEILFDQTIDFPLTIPPLAQQDILYLASPEGEVGAFHIGEKRLLWRTPTGEAVRALARGSGLVVASGDKGTLTALAAEDGQVRWTFRGQGGFEAGAVFDAEKEERLFIGDTSGVFYSLSADEGKERYRWKTGAAITVPALVQNKRVYVASHANLLFAYLERSGHEQWRADLPSRPATGPVAAGPFLALGTLNGEIVELNATSGKRGGTPYQTPADIRTPPTLAPPRVAVVLRSGKVILLGHPAPAPAPTETQPVRSAR